MAPPSAENPAPLRILHILRPPVGGLFRHVVDLTRGQIARGHAVGIVADAHTGGEMAERQFDALRPHLALGLMRLPIRRQPHPSDAMAALAIHRRVVACAPDIVHGHGSKGGAYARLTGLFGGRGRPIRIYTPHGGSFNYAPGSTHHRIFMRIEALLSLRSDALLFESAFVADRFEAFVGKPNSLMRIIPNGISPQEFEPVTPRDDADDLLFVGELREVKGVDTLIDALALLSREGLTPRLRVIGDGPDRTQLRQRAATAGVASQITFGTPLPAREAFALGRAMVVPSRFESLPYIVLEAAGAALPLVATNVGGMSEIYGPYADRLIAPNNPRILAKALQTLLTETPERRTQKARALSAHVAARFSADRMIDDVIAGYRDAIATRRGTP